MKRWIWVVLAALVLGSMGFGGCEKKKITPEEMREVIKEEWARIKEESKDILAEVESGEKPTLEEGESGTAEKVGTGLGTVAPMLPPPWNGVAKGLALAAPFVGMWLRAKNKTKKRTLEEKLLIAWLQEYKVSNPDGWEDLVKCRETAIAKIENSDELIKGINSLRYS